MTPVSALEPVLDPVPPAAPPRPPPRGASLTRRAGLTAAASLLDFLSRASVGFLIAPVLLSGLGRSLYGVWEILNRLVSHMVATDGRPTEALRLVVARHQDISDDATQRRYVGSALAVWLLFLPISCALGAVLIWISPTVVKASPGLVHTTRVTCALLVGAALASTLGAIPESVLQGMNLGYRRMGLQSLVNVLGGGLMALAMTLGLGLAGLADATLVVAVVSGLVFLLLARHYVDWFGAARPQRGEIRQLLGVSGWVAVGDTITRLMAFSDVVILGWVRSPALVTTYVLTGYATKALAGIVTVAIGSAMPGFGGLLGRGDLERAAMSRREIVAATWLCLTAGGGTILMWNHALLSLWVGPGQDAGPLVQLLVVLMGAQTVVIRTYVYMIDAALRTRFRVQMGALAAVLTVACSVAGTLWLGLPGLCLGVLVGRAALCLVHPAYVERRLFHSPALPPGLVAVALRALAITVLVYGVATWLGAGFTVRHWWTWAAGAGGTMALLTPACFTLGLPGEVRRALLARVAAVRR